MNLIFFEDAQSFHLQPLTLTRPSAELYAGAFSNSQRWAKMVEKRQIQPKISYLCANFLSFKYQPIWQAENWLVNGRFIPNEALMDAILSLPLNTVLNFQGQIVAVRAGQDLQKFDNSLQLLENLQNYKTVDFQQNTPIEIKNWWDLFQKNKPIFIQDFQLISQNKQSQPLSATNILIGDSSQIFIEEGATVEASVLNVKDAPIYVGKNAEIMENCSVRGGLALLESACLKMATKCYGTTTIAQGSKVGGELNNCVVFTNTNKAHDGFLGNSVLGSWVNLGADTNNSNLKNTYGNVQVWDYHSKKMINSQQQFCGMVVGDHSKFGINSMLNTGTVVGVFANIFGAGFPEKFVQSFSWGNNETRYDFEKAIQVAQTVMSRRGLQLAADDIQILKTLYQDSLV